MGSKIILFGIAIALAVISLAFAQLQESESEELARLSQELTDAGYSWLTNYTGDVSPKVEVYEKDGAEKIAEFNTIKDNEYNKIYLDGSSGIGLGNRTQDVFDLRVLGGSVEFDWIVDPDISGCQTLGTANTFYSLTGNTFSTGTCFTVTAQNITLAGNGFTVIYGTTGSFGTLVGVNVQATNFTLTNITLRTNNTGASHKAIIIPVSGLFTTVKNSNLTSEGTGDHSIAISTANNSIFIYDSFIGKGNDYGLVFTVFNNSNATLINTTVADGSAHSFNGTTNFLYNAWYIDARVNDTFNRGVENANVTAMDNSASAILWFSALTNSNGSIPKQYLVEYKDNWTGRFFDDYGYNNYTLNATKAGYSTQSKQINLSLTNNTFLSFSIGSNPLLNFVAPTLGNGSYTRNNFVEANVSLIEPSLREVWFNWNGTNYTIYNDSLVFFANLDNRSALLENNSHVKDLSLYGNNGSCYEIGNAGTPIGGGFCNITAGKYGLGVRFNGINQSINITDSNSLDITSSFSLSAWINVAGTPLGPNKMAGIIFKGNASVLMGAGTSSDVNYLLALENVTNGPSSLTRLTLYFKGANPTDDKINYTFSPTLNKWYYVVGVFDDPNNIMTLYLDGVNVTQAGMSGTPTSNTYNLFIGGGGHRVGDVSHFDGTIDEPMVWKRVFNANEVAELYFSNLQKYNSTNWVLYVNQSKNATTGLEEKAYTYFAAGKSDYWNFTDTRTVIVDSLPLNISFVQPTLNNGSSTLNASIEINASLLENNLKEVKFNWNGTNYTIYNGSLVLMYNFDNRSALKENDTHTADLSNRSNNGTVINPGSAAFISTGRYFGAYSLNGSGYITRDYDSDFDFGTNGFAVAVWFKQSALNSTIALVRNITGSTVGAGTSVTCTLGASPKLNNLLITAVASDKNAGTYTVPSGFTMINTTSATSTSGGLAYRISNGTETVIRWSQSSSSPAGIACWAAEYSRLSTNTSFVVDVSAENETFSGADTTTTTINSGSAGITSQANELAVAIVSIDTATSCDGSRAWTNGFSPTAFVSPGAGLTVATKILSSTGAQNTTYSCAGDTGDQMYAAIAAFKAVTLNPTLVARYDNDQGFKMWMNDSGNILFGIDDDAAWNPDDFAVSGTSYDDNAWHYAAGVRNATGIYIYIDGTLAGSDISIAASATLSSNSAPLSWGVDEPVKRYYWNGTLDEPRIWDYGLSSADVLQNYFSNLYQLNSTNWYLYVNQSKNSSDGLDAGTYTYFASASDTNNKGNSTDTRTVIVGAAPDTTPPIVTINFPANTTYGISNNILKFNVTLDENGSVMYSLNGGRNNKTMLYSADHVSVFGDVFNHTNNSITDGSYVFSVYANDTTGNRNYTHSITFSVDFSAPKINLTYPSNNSNLIGNNSVSLNWTISDISNNNEIFLWATNDSANLYDYLVYHRKNQVNDSDSYNWSAPVIRADPATTVLLLHFNNLSQFGESETVSVDSAQFDNNASLTNAVWNQTGGMFAGAFEMDGILSSRNIFVSDANVLDVKNFTIAMWFLKRGTGDTASSGSGGVVIVPLIAKAVAEADGDGRDVNFMLGINTSNNLAADFEDSAGPNHPVIGSQDVISNGVWYHVVYTHNFTTSTIYLNGKISKMSVINAQPANNAIRIGIGQTYNSVNTVDGAFNGSIDELVIYNQSLTYDEIVLLYNHSLGKKYWQVNATDGAGNMNNSFIFEFNMTVPAVAPVGDTTPPGVTINNPLIEQNISTSSLMFNVSLSENGSVMYSLKGGVYNKTMLFSVDHVSVFGNVFNHTNNSIADGSYVFSVYANDTTGNKNYTENRTFTIDTILPVPSYRTPRSLANGTQVNQSSIFIEGDIVDLNFKNVTFGIYNDSGYINESSLDYHYGFDLARYQRVLNNSDLALAVDTSDITYNPVNNTFFVIHNTIGTEKIDEIALNGSLIRSITLTGFLDTEAITYTNTSGGTHRLVVGEEGRANLTAIFVDDSTTTFAIANGVRYDLGLGNWANLGLEGVAYDSRRDVYYIVKEQRDMLVYQINVSTSPVTSTILINVTQINATQGHVINDLSSIYYDNNTDTLFLSSHESQHAYNIYRNGTIINNISINHMTQPEGITFDRFGDNMYVMGEADFLSSWKTANVSSSINYTGLGNGTYYYNITAYDYAGNKNTTTTRIIILGTVGGAPANAAPTTPTPDINSTRGSNRTSENLHCYDNLIDPDGGKLNVTVDWFNKTSLHLSVDYNNSYANNTFFDASLYHLNTTNGQNWTCGMRLFDGTDYSSRANTTYSVNVTALSVPVLAAPADASSTGDRSPNFTWSATTDDAASEITYQLNVSLIAASTCSEASRHITAIAATSHEVTSELMCFIDNNDYYNWSVRSGDGREFSSWSQFFKINMTSEITITMLNGTIEFGSMQYNGTDDTSDNSPLPFLLRNDGNAFVNITINASNLWRAANNPSAYYQFKIDNYTFENSSFNPGLSKVTYTNVPAPGAPLLAIAFLNYTNATDTVEIDINVSVPNDEGSGGRRSFITFISSLTGG